MYQEEGLASLRRGFRPTIAGYLLQGAAKFGFFELFKAECVRTLGSERAARNSMGIYLLSSATAETVASVLLCPFEALRIRKVGQTSFPKSILGGFRSVMQTDGVAGYGHN